MQSQSSNLSNSALQLILQLGRWSDKSSQVRQGKPWSCVCGRVCGHVRLRVGANVVCLCVCVCVFACVFVCEHSPQECTGWLAKQGACRHVAPSRGAREVSALAVVAGW
jgi:hypothetical protein